MRFQSLSLLLSTTIGIANADISLGGRTLKDAYDFVIIGGGTAGLALAARLTENSNQTVIVLEEGSKPEQVFETTLPLGLVLGTQVDWRFQTAPQASMNGRTVQYNRGRCLGGSSSINGLIYSRGSKSIYDSWGTLGNEGWSWSDIFKYFKKSTTFATPPRPGANYSGHDPDAYSNGPVQVGYAGYSTPASFSFTEAVAGVGIAPIVEDLNAGNLIGTKQETLALSSNYERSSSYTAYVQNIMNRTNLDIVDYVFVSEIAIEEIDGVQVAVGAAGFHLPTGTLLTIQANKEVILSAGAFQSPQLLMVSGVGPADELTKNGVAVKVDNPNVGKNLQDHTFYSVIVRADPSTSITNFSSNLASTLEAQALYAYNRTGPFTGPSGAASAYEQLTPAQLEEFGAAGLMNRTDQAHIEYFYEANYYPATPVAPQYPPRSNESYISITGGLVSPLSVGSITINSPSINDPPVIDTNYFLDPADQKIAVYALKQMRKILAHPSFAQWGIGANNGEVAPGASVQSDEDILNYIKDTAGTFWHASGTCAMLPKDKGGVVDNTLKVYDVYHLRVVDASVMPVIPDTPTQGTTYAIAEKAADMIRAEYGF